MTKYALIAATVLALAVVSRRTAGGAGRAPAGLGKHPD